MRIVFAGTPAFAVPSLEALINFTHDVIAVYTQPDRPSGRGQELQASAVKQCALKHSIPIYQPLNFKSAETINVLKELDADIMVVIAYGLILPRSVLEIPIYGCINVHASLLPRWRGAAPIQHAILHGDQYTGVTIMQMDAGMDTGNILKMTSIPIDSTETTLSLHDRLSLLAPNPLLETLNQIINGRDLKPTPQGDKGITYANKINKSDFLIDWSKPAIDIERQVRAFYPQTFTYAEHLPIRIQNIQILSKPSQDTPGTIIAIDKSGIDVATGTDCLRILTLQLPGKNSMQVHDWIHGNQAPLHKGLILK